MFNISSPTEILFHGILNQEAGHNETIVRILNPALCLHPTIDIGTYGVFLSCRLGFCQRSFEC